jgi:hypothetical protein
MFYRIFDNRIYDKADFMYAEDCKEILGYTTHEVEENPLLLTINGDELIPNPNYVNDIRAKREKEFYNEFFKTSLGWIRRKVTMQDGSIKDFLSDLLLQIKAGLDLGVNVEIITYKLPNFDKEPTTSYMESLQEKKKATMGFVAECLQITVKDFRG